MARSGTITEDGNGTRCGGGAAMAARAVLPSGIRRIRDRGSKVRNDWLRILLPQKVLSATDGYFWWCCFLFPKTRPTHRQRDGDDGPSVGAVHRPVFARSASLFSLARRLFMRRWVLDCAEGQRCRTMLDTADRQQWIWFRSVTGTSQQGPYHILHSRRGVFGE